MSLAVKEAALAGGLSAFRSLQPPPLFQLSPFLPPASCTYLQILHLSFSYAFAAEVYSATNSLPAAPPHILAYHRKPLLLLPLGSPRKACGGPAATGDNSCSVSGIRMPDDVAINRAPLPSEAEFLRPLPLFLLAERLPTGPHSKGPITLIAQDILVQPASGAVRRYTYGVLRLLVQGFHSAEVGDADTKAAAGAGTARASSHRMVSQLGQCARCHV